MFDFAAPVGPVEQRLPEKILVESVR